MVRVVLQVAFGLASANPINEPSIETFFGAPAEGEKFIPMERVRGISRKELERRTRAGRRPSPPPRLARSPRGLRAAATSQRHRRLQIRIGC